jgi:hypothetical protein
MKTTKLGISKVAAAAVLAGAMLATGLATARSRAETNANAPAPPVTKPADAGPDQPSAREDAAKALDVALLERWETVNVTNATDEQQRWIRRATWDLTGRPPTKEEVRVVLADPSPEARQHFIAQLIAAGPTTAPVVLTAAATQPVEVKLASDAMVNWLTADKQARYASDYLIALRAATSEPKVKAAYMGVGVDVPNDTVRAQLKLPEGSGLVVNYVDNDGPAKELIRQHDVLQKLDDQLLINAPQLVTLVRMHKPGETIQMTVIREAKPVTVPVKLSEKEMAPLSTYLSEQRGGDPLVSATTTAPPPTMMKIFALRTADAASAAQTVNQALSDDVAHKNLKVVSDERTNSLVVSGRAEAVKAVDTLIQKLDAPPAKDQNAKP